MLDSYRVLDLTDGAAGFCGYLFAQLGAKVVLIEPPEGGTARREEPRANGEGLWFEAYARGKQSVVTDDLEPLLAGADFLIETCNRPEAAAAASTPSSYRHAIHT